MTSQRLHRLILLFLVSQSVKSEPKHYRELIVSPDTIDQVEGSNLSRCTREAAKLLRCGIPVEIRLTEGDHYLGACTFPSDCSGIPNFPTILTGTNRKSKVHSFRRRVSPLLTSTSNGMFSQGTFFEPRRFPSKGTFFSAGSFNATPGESGYNRFLMHDVDRESLGNLLITSGLAPQDLIVEFFHLWNVSIFRVKSITSDGILSVDGDTGTLDYWRQFKTGCCYRFLLPGNQFTDRTGNILQLTEAGGISLPSKAGGLSTRFMTATIESGGFTLQGISDFVLSDVVFSENVSALPTLGLATQGSPNVPAWLNILESSRIKVTRCTFEGLPGYAIGMRNFECINISQCTFSALGAGALKAGAFGLPISSRSKDLSVINCTIKQVGLTCPNAPGLFVGICDDIKLLGNSIRSTGHSGISIGYSWGFSNESSSNCLVQDNHLTRIGDGRLSDLGAIYLLGCKNSIISNNSISEVQARFYGGWGIYLDEGCDGIEVRRNRVRQTSHEPFSINYAQNIHFYENLVQVDRTRPLFVSNIRKSKNVSFEKNLIAASEAVDFSDKSASDLAVSGKDNTLCMPFRKGSTTVNLSVKQCVELGTRDQVVRNSSSQDRVYLRKLEAYFSRVVKGLR